MAYVQETATVAYRDWRVVDDYAKIFGLSLTDAATAKVVEFLRPWSVLRRCCGPQMSDDYRQRLLNASSRPHRPPGALNYDACEMCFCCADIPRTDRGAAVAATRIFRGDESDAAAAATWIVRGDESRRRRGRDADIPWRRIRRRRGRDVDSPWRRVRRRNVELQSSPARLRYDLDAVERMLVATELFQSCPEVRSLDHGVEYGHVGGALGLDATFCRRYAAAAARWRLNFGDPWNHGFPCDALPTERARKQCEWKKRGGTNWGTRRAVPA